MRPSSLFQTSLVLGLLALSGCQSDPVEPRAPALQPASATLAGALAFRKVDAGGRHSCGVSPEDQAYCWGFNQLGQLGDGTTTTRFLPSP